MKKTKKRAAKKPTVAQLQKRIDKACDWLTAGVGATSASSWHYECMDNAVRALQGSNYKNYVKKAKAGDDGPNTYAWFTGKFGEQ